MTPRLPSDQTTGQPTKNLGSRVFCGRLSPNATPIESSNRPVQTNRENAFIAGENLQPWEGIGTASRAEDRARMGGHRILSECKHKVGRWMPPAVASCER